MNVKPKKLKNLFYRNFILLILIPILLIILIALGIIKDKVLDSATEKIELAQNNIVTTFNKELEDTALKLSHFLQTNENQILELANSYNLGNAHEKYEYNKLINRMLSLMMVSKSDVVAIHFYMKDGNALCLKDDLKMSLNILRQSIWYRKALEEEGRVFIGGMAKDVTYGKGYLDDVMVFTFVPRKQDNLDQIEMVCLYLNSSIEESIKNYEKYSELGEVYLVDGKGNVLIGKSNPALPEDILTSPAGSYMKTFRRHSMYYKISKVQVDGWKIINAVDTKVLLREFDQIANIIIAIAIGLFGLFILFSNSFLKDIINPINELVKGMKRVRSGNLEIQVKVEGQEELKELGQSFNSMIRQIRALIAYNERQQKEKHEVEIRALQSQINPHFLFNTLNAIKFMAMVAKFDSIKNMAESLMKIMSCTFKGTEEVYTVAEEIEVLKSYSYIMKIRYSDSFNVDFNIEPSILDAKIPRLLIQPILENAITHGFEEMEDIGEVVISGKLCEDKLIFLVEDNGKGMSKDKCKELLAERSVKGDNKGGIGLWNVQRRIQLTYGESYGLHIESEEDKYTKVYVCIPTRD